MEKQFSSENGTISRYETQSSNSSVRVHYSDPIPIDLLIDILSRVPSKSIARFRCVSKSWGSMLQRPDFIELFRTRCPGFLFTVEVHNEIFYFYSPQHPNPDENSYVVATRYDTLFPKNVPSIFRDIYNTMLYGLVLRQKHWRCKGRAICNPATGEFFNLPKVHSKVRAIIRDIYYFGYDPINKQLKVLCMTKSNTHRVLTLENRKRLWRRIESEFDYKERYGFINDICINGVLYFGSVFKGSYEIVCFDVRYEKFSLINMDKDMVETENYPSGWMTLVNYKGKLGIHKKQKKGEYMFSKENTTAFELWVLDDAGNHKWSKQEHEYPPLWRNIVFDFENELHIIGMNSTGEMVFAPYNLSNPFYIYYYNLERKTYTRVNIRGFEEISHEKSRTDHTYRDHTRIETFMDYGENLKLFK